MDGKIKKKLQVFVSSTYTDLIVERQAAVAAILKAGHIPAGMELFTAGSTSQMDTIKRWIDESDAYMLILGGRYGSIESKTRVSYTELEYDYAVSIGKQIFSVVINENALEEKVKKHGTSILEKQYNSELANFRSKVLTNISSFFSDEKDIRLCVHESLAELREHPTVIGWVSASNLDDIRAIREENSRLRSEIEQLKLVLDRAKSSPVIEQGKNLADFNRISRVFLNVKIKLPDEIRTEDTSNEHTLMNLFLLLRDNLAIGITNSIKSNDLENFYYHNVCPKLMTHGMVRNEAVSGVQYRRSFLTDFGLEFLAAVDRGELDRDIMDEIQRFDLSLEPKDQPSK